MKQFRNLLVGVDLSEGDRLVSSEPVPASVAAMEAAFWLAEQQRSRIVLCAVLDVSPAAQHRLEAAPEAGGKLIQRAKDVLQPYVERARQCNPASEVLVKFGKSWYELLRSAVSDKHGLVIVGASQEGPLESMLLGSTVTRLVRKCPCPVWVVPSQGVPTGGAVLVATDLSPTCEIALELGGAFAKLSERPLHVVHVEEDSPAEFQEVLQAADNGGVDAEEVRNSIREAAQRLDLGSELSIHVLPGQPEEQILNLITQEQIRILSVGTVARTGISGLLLGNTSERLLTRVPCSLLVVKPPGFHCPVRL